MQTLQISIYVLGFLILLALLFDFMNGFHDAANAIATVVSTGVLRPQHAVMLAAFFNFVAIFVFHLSVAATVGKGTIDPTVVDHYVVFGALIGAIAWNGITWYYGIPSSSSHALIGGLVGAAVAKAGTGSLIAAGLIKTIAFIVLSPLLGFLFGTLMMIMVSWLFVRSTPGKVDKWFRRLQLVSASMYSLGHGGNDAQKTMGIIWMLLIAAGVTTAKDPLPLWVIVSCYAGHRPGHAVRRLAHRQDHGAEDHQAQTGGRLLRRDRRRHHAVPGHLAGHPGVHHPHHHRRHRRRRLGKENVGGALGRGRQHRLGLGLHHPGVGLHGGGGLVDRDADPVSLAGGKAIKKPAPRSRFFCARTISGRAGGDAYSTSLAKSARRERSPRARVTWPPWAQPLKRSTT